MDHNRHVPPKKRRRRRYATSLSDAVTRSETLHNFHQKRDVGDDFFYDVHTSNNKNTKNSKNNQQYTHTRGLKRSYTKYAMDTMYVFVC